MPTVNEQTVDWLKSYSRPTVKKRAERYLGAAIGLLDGKLIGRVEISDHRLRVASWSYHSEDCVALARYLEKLGALESVGNGQEMLVVANGHQIYDQMTEQRTQSSQVFVAMWFGDTVREIYDRDIGPAIREAGFYGAPWRRLLRGGIRTRTRPTSPLYMPSRSHQRASF